MPILQNIFRKRAAKKPLKHSPMLTKAPAIETSDSDASWSDWDDRDRSMRSEIACQTSYTDSECWLTAEEDHQVKKMEQTTQTPRKSINFNQPTDYPRSEDYYSKVFEMVNGRSPEPDIVERRKKANYFHGRESENEAESVKAPSRPMSTFYFPLDSESDSTSYPTSPVVDPSQPRLPYTTDDRWTAQYHLKRSKSYKRSKSASYLDEKAQTLDSKSTRKSMKSPSIGRKFGSGGRSGSSTSLQLFVTASLTSAEVMFLTEESGLPPKEIESRYSQFCSLTEGRPKKVHKPDSGH